jgi:hypothetical protein
LDTDAAPGRALARVLSHELYHVLARTTGHAREGVAKPSLAGADLSSAYLAFAPEDADRMTFPREDSVREHRWKNAQICPVNVR